MNIQNTGAAIATPVSASIASARAPPVGLALGAAQALHRQHVAQRAAEDEADGGDQRRVEPAGPPTPRRSPASRPCSAPEGSSMSRKPPVQRLAHDQHAAQRSSADATTQGRKFGPDAAVARLPTGSSARRRPAPGRSAARRRRPAVCTVPELLCHGLPRRSLEKTPGRAGRR